MRRAATLMFVASLLAVLTRSESMAQDAAKYWPQWRGPMATGVAPQADPPVTWSEEQNIKWKVKCPGGGSASPIVWGDKVFVLAALPTDKPGASAPAEAAPALPFRGGLPARGAQGARGGGRGFGRMGRSAGPSVAWKFEVVCFDRQTGRILWQKTAREEVPHEGVHQTDGGYACYSPVTDGEHLYAYFGSRGLFCYDLDGNPVWERELGKMNIVMQFGEGGSPVLCGDKIIVKRDHEGPSSIVALDKNSGDTAWQVDRNEATSWSTPIVVEHEGKTQIVTAATNRIRAYEPDDGKLIWECGGLGRNVIPTPLTGFDMVFATSGFGGSALLAIELGHTGDLTNSDAVKWRVNRGTPYVPSPLLYGDKVYVLQVNDAILSCYQAPTGEADFVQTRLAGLSNIYASPVGAAERVYLVARDGKTMVIKRSSELEVLATNALDERFDATPALVDGEIFLRGKEHLYCISEN